MPTQKERRGLNMLNGKTKIYGVLGDPIEHTLSPFLHNSVMKELGYNGAYLPFHVKRDDLGSAIKGAHALKIQGLNVTVPHKEKVMNSLVKMDDFAKQTGAVNTLKYTQEGYEGYNTDVYGLLTSLQNNGIQLKDKKILLIGAGGAAKAAAMMCASQGVQKIMIMNRTLKRAEELACAVKSYYDVSVEIYPISGMPLEKSIDICIQTTSLGMHPQEDKSPVTRELCKKIKIAVDIIYNPEETLFLKMSKEEGATTLNGLEMLFYQGIKAYEIWTRHTLTKEQQHNLLRELKDYLGRRTT